MALLMGMWLPHAAGQSLPESLAKTPGKGMPAAGIQDSVRVLGRDSETAQRISGRIRKMEQDHGFRIYLVIEPVLIGTSAPEMANEMRRKWLPEGDGLVVVFESDTRKLGFGQDMVGNPNQPEHPGRVPSYEATAIVNRALAGADANLEPEDYLEKVINPLIDGFEAYFKRRQAAPPKERSVRTALLVVGGLALLGLGVIGAGGLIRHSSMARVRSYRFPVVDRPERLGAPCGGSVTARRFAPPVKA